MDLGDSAAQPDETVPNFGVGDLVVKGASCAGSRKRSNGTAGRKSYEDGSNERMLQRRLRRDLRCR